MKRFFWALVSNNDDEVSTGTVYAGMFMICYCVHFAWITFHPVLSLKVSPLEAAGACAALMAVPKAPAVLKSIFAKMKGEGSDSKP